jgi:alanine racemase
VIAMSEPFFGSQPSPGEISERVEGYASWLEVDLDLLDHNLDRVREWTGVEIVPCVKSNAYGHGVVPIVAAMMRRGVRRVLVAKLWEAMQIRGAGLDCGVVSVDPLYSGRQCGEVVEGGITQAVFSRGVAERLSQEAVKRGRDTDVWVKVDTGLGRVGVRHGVAADLIAEVASMPGLEVSGVFSTLAEDRELDRVQRGRLLEVREGLRRRGVDVPCMSLASSNAVFHFPDAFLDAVRPGLMLYGLYPEPEDRGVGLELRPVMSFRARLEQVKLVGEGESLTYSRRFVAPRGMAVGTVHAGYSDGVPRGLTGVGLVRVGGEVRPILGTVSVNHHLVDVDGLDVGAGDVVEVVSRDGENSLEGLSALAGIMPYSFCVGLNPLTPRVYLRGGRPVALSEPRLLP